MNGKVIGINSQIDTGGTGNGNVGIGTSSPFVKLDVSGNEATNGVMASVYNFSTSAGSTSSFAATNGVGVNVQLQTFNNYALVNCTSNHNLELRTNNQPRLVITNTGGTDTQGNPITGCPTTAKAWVNFNGASLAIRSNYNVSSITKNGVGDYTVNYAVPLNNADYTVSGNCSINATSPSLVNLMSVDDSTPRTASSCRIQTALVNSNTNKTPFDAGTISFQVFGN
jgi:hypothetical protein